MKLIEIAARNDYSRELQQFLRLVPPWNEDDVFDAVKNRQPEKLVLELSLRPQREGTFETETAAKDYFVECEQEGKAKYAAHCSADGRFRYEDFGIK